MCVLAIRSVLYIYYKSSGLHILKVRIQAVAYFINRLSIGTPNLITGLLCLNHLLVPDVVGNSTNSENKVVSGIERYRYYIMCYT